MTDEDPPLRADLLERLRVDGRLDLSDHDPAETFGWDKDAAKDELDTVVAEVARLQTRLFAEQADALLLVLQAMDAGGKDGVLREVLTGLNPAGVRVRGFGVPTEEERAHDFLWRIHQHTPAKGEIVVFNRSHYEDVLVVRVKDLAPEAQWRARYEHIRRFEALLNDAGTAVVKIFLHVSEEEQRERFQDRIDDPEEQWKFRRGDLDDRALWDEYMKAYRDALTETSVEHAPWFVVPGDRKWVRNLCVAHILRDALHRLDPQFPEAEEGIDGIVVE
jgi:PPK2 family polyphosphate:nucleotide phosphotransferase